MRILTGLPCTGASPQHWPLPRGCGAPAYDASRPLDVREVGMQMRSAASRFTISPSPAKAAACPRSASTGERGFPAVVMERWSSNRDFVVEDLSTWPSVVSREWRHTPHMPDGPLRSPASRGRTTRPIHYVVEVRRRSTCSPRAPRSTQRASPIRASFRLAGRRPSAVDDRVRGCCVLRPAPERRLRAAPLLALSKTKQAAYVRGMADLDAPGRRARAPTRC